MTGKFIDRAKRWLRTWTPCILARETKHCPERDRKEIDTRDRIVISLKPEQASQGSVLLSYIIDPFLLKPGQPLPNTHTRYWESLQIARTFLELGYCVDVISWKNCIDQGDDAQRRLANSLGESPGVGKP